MDLPYMSIHLLTQNVAESLAIQRLYSSDYQLYVNSKHNSSIQILWKWLDSMKQNDMLPTVIQRFFLFSSSSWSYWNWFGLYIWILQFVEMP